jgi:hypothetical protein
MRLKDIVAVIMSPVGAFAYRRERRASAQVLLPFNYVWPMAIFAGQIPLHKTVTSLATCLMAALHLHLRRAQRTSITCDAREVID